MNEWEQVCPLLLHTHLTSSSLAIMIITMVGEVVGLALPRHPPKPFIEATQHKLQLMIKDSSTNRACDLMMIR